MIIKFALEKIIAEKNIDQIDVKKELEAKNNLKVLNVEEHLLSGLTKEEVLKIKFLFSVVYSPKIANIDLTGFVLYMVDEKKRKEILNGWKKDKKLDSVVAQKVINYALNRCNIRALHLGQELNLPPHIPFPRISIKQTEEKKKK